MADILKSLLSDTKNITSFLDSSSWLMIIVGQITLISLFFITAPYGRHAKPKGWGPLIPAKLAWFLMESPNLWAAFTIFMLGPSDEMNAPNKILLVCFVTHYVNRAIVFPLSMRESSPMPLSVMLLAFSFCLWNGLNQTLSLIIVTKYPDEYVNDKRFLFGVILFYIGFLINIRSDNILVKLRKDEDGENKGKKYVIPVGGFFQYVSCANYFGEIVEWLGFALASWSLPGIAFAFYTIANLVPRALQHHKWYKKKFEDYPKERKAVIPFIL